MATYSFAALANGATVAFDTQADVLLFGDAITASEVRLALSGGSLAVSLAGKTVLLSGVTLEALTGLNLQFASDRTAILSGDVETGTLVDWYGADYSGLPGLDPGDLQVNGLGGADFVVTGGGNDLLVGNGPLEPLVHVSQVGGTGAPTQTSFATVSADGRFVAFSGGWTGFGSSTDSSTDVLVKDLQTGTVSNEHRSSSGTRGLSGSGDPVISADGLHLVFTSSSQLQTGTTTPSNTVWVAGTTSGAIEAVSRTAGGAFGNLGGNDPDISADGRYVVFASRSSNLAAGGNITYEDIYLKDRVTGALTRVSTGQAGGDGNSDSVTPKVSADGRYVVFSSAATNLTTAETGGGHSDVYLWDRQTGTLTNITAGLGGTASSLRPDIAFDGVDPDDPGDNYGGIIVFETGKELVAADDNNATDIYAYDIATGTFELVSARANGGTVSGASAEASVSGDGRFVVFRGFSDELVAGDTNGVSDIFVKDRVTGEIALVSRTPAAQADQASSRPSISLGGEWIVFESSASNLAASDDNGSASDVYRVSNPLLRDTLQGGLGNDTYVVARADILIEAANAGADTVESAVSWTLGENFEALRLTGSAASSGTGNGLANRILGNGAANRLTGDAGNDTLTGAGGNDTLNGGSGGDSLDGGSGADSMAGGSGNDTYVVGSLSDVVVESSTLAGEIDTVRASLGWTLGANLERLVLTGTAAIGGTGNALGNGITGNGGANTLSGEGGADTLSGGGGEDRLTGGDGDDRLDGGTGNDTLLGAAGSDTYVVDSAQDIISETSTVAGEIDTVRSAVTWTLGSTLENLLLTGTAAINGTGNAAANAVTGNAGANRLDGAGGADRLSGGSGNDTLTGGSGNDLVTGGTGADQFRFNSASGADTITDFVSGADRFAISMAALPIGDADLLVEGALTRGSPGGFAPGAELVVFTTNLASLDASAVAAAIGSATSPYAVGRSTLFAVDNGTDSAVFRFTAADANAVVSASELKLLALLKGTAATALADFTLVA
jgi:Ca2+-binding RTX toxin-like protein